VGVLVAGAVNYEKLQLWRASLVVPTNMKNKRSVCFAATLYSFDDSSHDCPRARAFRPDLQIITAAHV
jgi:hypothetical protein